MSQAKNPHTTNPSIPSRRRVLAGLSMAAAAVPAAASVDNALAGAHAGATDPIFAAIRAHDRAMAHEVACVHRDSGLDEALPEDRTTWHYDVCRPTAPEGCTDAPEWIAAQNAICDAYRRRYDAVFALLTTPPTTVPGAVALLGYVGSFEFPGEPGAGEPMLFVFPELADERVQEAALAFPAVLAATLLRLIAAA